MVSYEKSENVQSSVFQKRSIGRFPGFFLLLISGIFASFYILWHFGKNLPDYKELLEITPALKKKKGFTNYEELMTFLTDLKNKFPDILAEITSNLLIEILSFI